MYSQNLIKTFTHNPLERIHLEKAEIDGERYYQCGDEFFLSITTLLSKQIEKQKALDKWRKRIGYENARKKTQDAAERGDKFHKNAEIYLQNEEGLFHTDFSSRSLFFKARPFINNIDNILAQEYPLYSKTLKIAGTVDLVADYKNEQSIIDFKTSGKEKKREWIEDYFIQTTAYSYMIEELYNIVIKRLTILIVCEEGWVQVFQDYRKNYRDKLFKLLLENNNYGY